MRLRKLGSITIGIAGAAGTSGIGIMVSRLASGHGSDTDNCLMLAASFITTSVIAALGLILNYRLERLVLQAQASAAQRNADLRITRLEFQRAILNKIQDGTMAAQAYQRMTAADALYARSHRPRDRRIMHLSTNSRARGSELYPSPYFTRQFHGQHPAHRG